MAKKSTTEQLRRSLCTRRPLPRARARPLRVCRPRSCSASARSPRGATWDGARLSLPWLCPARHSWELCGAAQLSGLLLLCPKPVSFKVRSQFSLFLAKWNCLEAPSLCSLDHLKFITLCYSYSNKHSWPSHVPTFSPLLLSYAFCMDWSELSTLPHESTMDFCNRDNSPTAQRRRGFEYHHTASRNLSTLS